VPAEHGAEWKGWHEKYAGLTMEQEQLWRTRFTEKVSKMKTSSLQPREQINTITDLLEQWEDLGNKERREITSSANYFYKKYSVSRVSADPASPRARQPSAIAWDEHALTKQNLAARRRCLGDETRREDRCAAGGTLRLHPTRAFRQKPPEGAGYVQSHERGTRSCDQGGVRGFLSGLPNMLETAQYA
jgi:hypothetical protein